MCTGRIRPMRLTRFVRLPIPTQKQLNVLQAKCGTSVWVQFSHWLLGAKAKLIDFEKQGVAKMMRLPFQDHQDT